MLRAVPGRYCWSCDRPRPNERFSRRSGLRGVCRDCYRLGPAELGVRQAVRTIDRALRHSVFIPRRQRAMIDGFRTHADPRIRAYAGEVIAQDAAARAEDARLRHDDELAFEAMAAAEHAPGAIPDPADWDDDDIPF